MGFKMVSKQALIVEEIVRRALHHLLLMFGLFKVQDVI